MENSCTGSLANTSVETSTRDASASNSFINLFIRFPLARVSPRSINLRGVYSRCVGLSFDLGELTIYQGAGAFAPQAVRPSRARVLSGETNVATRILAQERIEGIRGCLTKYVHLPKVGTRNLCFGPRGAPGVSRVPHVLASAAGGVLEHQYSQEILERSCLRLEHRFTRLFA